MSGKFQRTYREACPSSASSHERYYMPHPTPPHPTRAYMHLPAATEKRVLPPQVHMKVITCPTPPHPHPTRAYMHLPAAPDKHVLPPQVHMNVITCRTPPHPTPPMCTKHHGLLKAVVQLNTHIYIYVQIHTNLCVNIYTVYVHTYIIYTYIYTV